MEISQALSKIRKVPDYPKPGILFQDITPLLADAEAFDVIVDSLSRNLDSIDVIAGIEARGFILASALASKLRCGFIPLRKAGKLPFHVFSERYELEYGTAELEIHQDALLPGLKVVLVDDVLATGGTITAALRLIQRSGGTLDSVLVLMEITALKGRSQIEKEFPEIEIRSLLSL